MQTSFSLAKQAKCEALKKFTGYCRSALIFAYVAALPFQIATYLLRASLFGYELPSIPKPPPRGKGPRPVPQPETAPEAAPEVPQTEEKAPEAPAAQEG